MQVTSIMLLKTNGSKMPEIGLSIILLKINNVQSYLHYVAENKWS